MSIAFAILPDTDGPLKSSPVSAQGQEGSDQVILHRGRLWVHEVYRVFYDRLVEDSDRTWLYSLVKDCVKNHFKDSFESVFERLVDSKGQVR